MKTKSAFLHSIGWVADKTASLLFLCTFFICCVVALSLSIALIMIVGAAAMIILASIIAGVIIMAACALILIVIYALNNSAPAWIEWLGNRQWTRANLPGRFMFHSRLLRERFGKRKTAHV